MSGETAASAGFGFEIVRRDPASRARLGRLTTPHGTIDTPNFVFCGTKGSVKGLTPDQVRAARTDIILANTYHLMIQPGADTVAALGGLHRMMGWDGPMMTDSGGFQIFSMGHGSVADEVKGRRNAGRDAESVRPPSLLKITEEGAVFRSYLDGSKLFLSPEESMRIQRKLGADLIFQFDECTPFHVPRAYTAKSMELSHRWGDRSLAEFARHDDGRQGLYGIVQGGVYPDLRRISAEYTADRPFFGTGIGGSLGADRDQMLEVVSYATPFIHPERPVHLLGIGGVKDIFAGVRLGIDTFDCVTPTRVARHGWAIVKGQPKERLNLRNARFRTDTAPIDESCGCATCTGGFSRGYLHHLLKAGEVLATVLITAHNVYTMNRLMRDVRRGLADGTLDAEERAWVAD